MESVVSTTAGNQVEGHRGGRETSIGVGIGSRELEGNQVGSGGQGLSGEVSLQVSSYKAS